jgi:membrane-associated phospholipid phosphatase
MSRECSENGAQCEAAFWPGLGLTPMEILAASFITGASIVGAMTGAPVGKFLARVGVTGAALAGVSFGLLRWGGAEPRLIRALSGISLCFVVYNGLTPLLEKRVPSSAPVDAWLRAMEERVLGTTLVKLVEPYASDSWTRFFCAAYALHAPLFYISPLLHWRRGRRTRAEHLLLTLAATMYLGFTGYALFPAKGPVGAMPELRELKGNFATRVVAEQGVDLGTFPSLHAAICTIIAIDGWRTSPLWGLPSTAAVLLIWSSTIYLRYHWVLDLLAGASLGGLVTWLMGKPRS